jgi:AbrB family looped-hinge helix DNA binding protein
MRITEKGQVTIPIDIRERYGFLPNTEVDFVVENDTVTLVRRESSRSSRGAEVIRRLRGTGSIRMTTDEIMALTRS